jgi:hypothetical protein
MGKIGTFLPIVLDHQEKSIPIYPTIPDDISHFIEIFGIYEKFVKARYLL